MTTDLSKHLKQIWTKEKGNYPKWLPANTHYVTIMGSMAYNCHHPYGEKTQQLSDMDLYGFGVPPKAIVFPHTVGYINGFGTHPENFEQYQKHHIQGDVGYEYDVNIFSIVKYFHLLLGNNPNMIDSIFTPLNCVIHMTPLGKMVKDNRHLFLSKQVHVKMSKYAYGQLRKLESNAHAGSYKRQQDIAKNGFDTKKGYHTVRLILQAEQILMEGDLDLTRNAEVLKDIRAGNWTLDRLQNYFLDKEKILDQLYITSKLPEYPDENKIKQLLFDCLEHHYGSLSNSDIKLPDKTESLVQELKNILGKYEK